MAVLDAVRHPPGTDPPRSDSDARGVRRGTGRRLGRARDQERGAQRRPGRVRPARQRVHRDRRRRGDERPVAWDRVPVRQGGEQVRRWEQQSPADREVRRHRPRRPGRVRRRFRGPREERLHRRGQRREDPHRRPAGDRAGPEPQPAAALRNQRDARARQVGLDRELRARPRRCATRPGLTSRRCRAPARRSRSWTSAAPRAARSDTRPSPRRRSPTRSSRIWSTSTSRAATRTGRPPTRRSRPRTRTARRRISSCSSRTAIPPRSRSPAAV